MHIKHLLRLIETRVVFECNSFLSSATIFIRLIETRVVFEFLFYDILTFDNPWLIETRVVFECSSPSIISTKEIRLIETRVVFEYTGITQG